MLGGIAPIIIFNLYKKIEKTGENPIMPIELNPARYALPPIPIYLDEQLTGIIIQSESKNIDIDTTVDATKKNPIASTPEAALALATAGTPEIEANQKPINSTISIQMVASVDSIGITLLSSMIDTVYPLVTSKEYSITYLHAGITLFNGLLHSFQITQTSDNTLYNINLQLIRVSISTKPAQPDLTIKKLPDAVPLDRGLPVKGTVPT